MHRRQRFDATDERRGGWGSGLGRWAAVLALMTLQTGPASGAEGVEAAAAVERPSALAQFTTSVEDREPVDQITFVDNDVRRIFFFSDLRGLAGRTVTHRWMHEGEVRAEVAFDVRGPRWRVWSSKALLEGWLGDWTVEIVADDGEVIAAETFTYKDAGR